MGIGAFCYPFLPRKITILLPLLQIQRLYTGFKRCFLYLSSPTLSALSSVALAKEDLSYIILQYFNMLILTMQNVYILKCSDQTFYTGCTEDLDARIKRHHAGYVEYTKSRLPVELIFFSSFITRQKAFD